MLDSVSVLRGGKVEGIFLFVVLREQLLIWVAYRKCCIEKKLLEMDAGMNEFR